MELNLGASVVRHSIHLAIAYNQAIREVVDPINLVLLVLLVLHYLDINNFLGPAVAKTTSEYVNEAALLLFNNK